MDATLPDLRGGAYTLNRRGTLTSIDKPRV